MRTFFIRHQPDSSLSKALIAGMGGGAAIATLGGLADCTHLAYLTPPFGATCVLMFSAPASPLSQPANIIGGHLLAALVGLICAALLPPVWWAAAIAVGVAIAVMQFARVTHPPAGATPLIVLALQPGIGFLFFPVLSGTVLLVVIGTFYHRYHRVPYPLART
ncbi:HPP family protein [Rhizobium sp. CFBP 8762]|uniref:HPP family protein n=1 Tax=Rhizobium sp. CFBP 8762 TaxID=2775279 RepID=UPI00177CA4E5|nr:HPP family protein [Rhizobium sp. CFBP 8762]MBD8553216.1 HPP family protein [Rhizobium sp. CFBP 8762]